MNHKTSGLVENEINDPGHMSAPNIIHFAFAALLVGMCSYLAGTSLHHIPPWAVAICIFGFSVLIMLPRIYVRTLKRVHENNILRKEGILFKFRTKRFFLVATSFAISLFVSFYTLLQLNIMEPKKWLAFFLSFPVFYLVYLACYKFISKHVEPLHVYRVSLSWASMLSPIMLVGMLAIATWNSDYEISSKSLRMLIESKRSHLVESNGSALVDESLQIVAAAAGAHTYLEGKIGMLSGALSKFISIADSLLIGYFSASLLSCFLISRIEYRRVFGQLTTDAIPKPIKPIKIAALSAISVFVFGFVYLHGFVAIETGVRQNPQWRAEREKIEKIIFTEVDEIAGRNYTPGTIRLIQEARSQTLSASEAALATIEPQIDIAFMSMEQNVDIYLDWYYSLPAEYARLGLVLTGRVEEHLASKLTESLNHGDPFKQLSSQVTLAVSQSAAAEKIFQDKKARILAANHIPANDGLFRVVSRLSQAELDTPAAHPTISSIEQRMTGAGAVGVVTGAVTAKAVGKVMGKTAFKAAAKGASKIFVSKTGGSAAGAAAGAAIGSIIPGIGTVVGGVVGFGVGLATGVALDYAMVNLEEVIARDSFKAELVGAIHEAKSDFRASLLGPSAFAQSPAGTSDSGGENSFPVARSNKTLTTLSRAISESGLPSEIEVYAPGDYWIRSTSNGLPFFVYLDECNQAGSCRWVVFLTKFTGYNVSKNQLESWTAADTIAEAYFDDEGAIVLQMSIDVTDGRVSKADLVQYTRTWSSTAVRFYEQLVQWDST